MLFALGFIAGVVVATFVAAVLAYFRKPIISMLATAETALGNAGPRPRGAIYMPRDEADAVRDRVVSENRAKGKDTPISELQ